MATISICIPTYSNPKSFKRLMDSIFMQSYDDYEIIITDDSKDNSVYDVIQQYNSNKIFYYKNSQQLGSPRNWNQAISNATSQYIKIMHHDDYFSTKDALQKIVDALNDYRFVFVQSNHILDGDCISVHEPAKKEVERYIKDPKLLLLGNIIGAPSAVAYHKTLLQYDNNIKWFVDVDFYIRYIKSLDISDVNYLEEAIVNIGIDNNRVTNDCINNKHLIYDEFFYSLKKGFNDNYFNLRDLFVCSYKFVKNYRVNSFNEVSPYITGYIKGILFIAFYLYRIKRCL